MGTQSSKLAKIIEGMKKVIWDDTRLEQDPKNACTTFYDTLLEIYNTCFPIGKMDKNFINKPRLWSALHWLNP